MARPRKSEEPWYPLVVQRMVQDSLTYRQALTAEGIGLTSDEAETHFRRAEFQKLLRLERNRFYKELANDPERTKQTAIGMLVHSLERLQEAGEDVEVVEGILKLARVEGWIGGDTAVNILSGMTGREIEDARLRVLQQLKAEIPNGPGLQGTDPKPQDSESPIGPEPSGLAN